jgi:hypothetical protein
MRLPTYDVIKIDTISAHTDDCMSAKNTQEEGVCERFEHAMVVITINPFIRVLVYLFMSHQ